MTKVKFEDLPINKLINHLSSLPISPIEDNLSSQWRAINPKEAIATEVDIHKLESDIEKLEVDWLINVFNQVFRDSNTLLVRGKGEPEYFPANKNQPARIEFAHGFFSSALHELSHWCVAGNSRRLLPDYGYWYAPDGRNQAQQMAFERVEIKPQALECLFTLMCGKTFRVSQDNLNAKYDTSKSTFSIDVYNQAKHYIEQPQELPKDARLLLTYLAKLCHDINVENVSDSY